MTEETKRCGFVSLIGAPNAGKSTITNDFVGSKVSIVSPKAQTTRTQVKGIGIFENTQIIFLDTPGIFKPKRRLDRSMVASAWHGASDADILVLVVDAKKGFDSLSRSIVDELNKQKRKAILLLNKTDLIEKQKLLPLIQEINNYGNFEQTFLVSAYTKDGIEDFYRYLANNLPLSTWFYPEEYMSDMPLRLLAAEIVREKLFLMLQEEIPYSLTVEPENWERKEDGSIKAEMSIYIEREGQKKIIIGRGGDMIKKIGLKARTELEYLLDCRVHLFLYVKVREKWIDDPARYSSWGLDYQA